jgi:hypothetical protein
LVQVAGGAVLVVEGARAGTGLWCVEGPLVDGVMEAAVADVAGQHELQAWLGHRSPESTQHYAKITPNTLAKAYNDAGYFARNVRTIEVLVDRDAVANGAATAAQPWQHYDLGHGFCSYTFFEQCPHRMACARCDFYIPKQSSKSELLQAKSNLQRMLVSIPLTDEEQAAVEDGQAALDDLLQRLADIPTPAGSTPRQLTATSLPIIAVNHGRSART